MPSQEAIVNTMVPREVEKPIPTRTVSTRVPKSNPDQVPKDRSEPAVVDSQPTAESVKLSPQLSALARKEQAYRQREQALKVREKELEAKLSEAEQYSQLKTKLGTKDYSEAEKLGLDYAGYTQYLIDKQAGEDPQALKFKQLEDEIQALKKSKEDSATQEYEETVAEYKKEVDSLIANSAEFPRIKKLGRQDAVLQLILDSWEQDETEMTVAEASKDVEAYLTALAKDLQVAEPVAEVMKTLPPPRQGSRTLNQNMAAVGVEAKPLKPLQYLSESERYAEARRRALARREGKL